MHRRLAFIWSYANNPLPNPPPREGDLFSRCLNRGFWTRHGPRLAVAALPWPGTRTASSLTQPKDVSPGEPAKRVRPGVHAVQIAKISSPLTDRPQATSHMPQASSVTTHYVPNTGPCCTNIRDFISADCSTTSHRLRATGQCCYNELRTTYHVLIGRAHVPAPTTRYALRITCQSGRAHGPAPTTYYVLRTYSLNASTAP